MAHWNPNNPPPCRTCQHSPLRDVSSHENGDFVFWCPCCGTLLKANEYEPISASDWKMPALAKLTEPA